MVSCERESVHEWVVGCDGAHDCGEGWVVKECFGAACVCEAEANEAVVECGGS